MDSMSTDPRWLYRQVIDAMVVECATGQGQVSAHRIRVGLWNEVAEEEPQELPEQHAMNALLARLSPEEREVLAQLFAEEFSSGMFHALNVLHAASVDPVVQGYDGTPADDFLGRMDGWVWP